MAIDKGETSIFNGFSTKQKQTLDKNQCMLICSSAFLPGVFPAHCL